MPRRVLGSRQREAHVEIERASWGEGFSEFVYDEEREVIRLPERERRIVLGIVW